ncbi:hypothetical protein [Anaerosporobacter faecicola]|uniref:hypothetical protein n=1 Tax=Anaerosporobacter faecicola TaxID=2718714 RepID=UPI001438FF27|nr:hypothetical protein [Anaerosporobacter faecicola]
MKKVKLTIVSIISILIFTIIVIGCNNIKSKPDITRVMPSEDSSKVIDYNQYLKKIWVMKNWAGGGYNYFSFFISRIEDGVIEGKLSTGSIAEPEFYFYSFDSTTNLGDLTGTVNNGIAECKFSDQDGNEGNVTLIFKENDEIEVTIEYTDKGSAYKDLSLDGNYHFRPYNLTDLEDFIPLKEYSFEKKINSWGSVNFVSGEVNHGDRFYPAAYLTNEYDDIFYEFQASFQTGTKIIEVSIKDINGDGLEDIKIVTAFEDSYIENIEWIFYQRDDGLFYNSNLDIN